MAENKIKMSTILDGVVIPLILVLLIFVFAVYLNVGGTHHILGDSNIIAVILVSGFAQMIILGVPLILGLLWNKWAGGCAGFIMGGLYYVASAGQYNGLYSSLGVTTYNFFGDVSMLFYLVNAVVIGYMAGALNNGSTNFIRMIGSGLTASLIVAFIQAYLNITVSLEPGRNMAIASWATDPFMAVVINFLPSILLGIIVPILGKVMTWYGLQPKKQSMAGY
ncbi:MAG TPA: hypothetical protein VLH35_01205 [Candidatus Acidoferrales bacterium]|nr:hypothetical protein [Candidatus Acidoferrales bacterium]